MARRVRTIEHWRHESRAGAPPGAPRGDKTNLQAASLLDQLLRHFPCTGFAERGGKRGAGGAGDPRGHPQPFSALAHCSPSTIVSCRLAPRRATTSGELAHARCPEYGGGGGSGTGFNFYWGAHGGAGRGYCGGGNAGAWTASGTAAGANTGGGGGGAGGTNGASITGSAGGSLPFSPSSCNASAVPTCFERTRY